MSGVSQLRDQALRLVSSLGTAADPTTRVDLTEAPVNETAPADAEIAVPPAQAAADLIEFCKSLPYEHEIYPLEQTMFERTIDGKKVKYLTATTVDGRKMTIPVSQAIDNMARRDSGGYVIPLFGKDSTLNKFLELVSRLEGAPAEDATGELGDRLFRSHNEWRWHLIQNGIYVWMGKLNPPGLDLEQYPERVKEDGTPIDTITFRFRSPLLGIVERIIDVYEDDVLQEGQSGVTGSALNTFKRNWIDDFAHGRRTVKLGNTEKSVHDIRYEKEAVSPEQFKSIFKMVDDLRRQRTRDAEKKYREARKYQQR